MVSASHFLNGEDGQSPWTRTTKETNPHSRDSAGMTHGAAFGSTRAILHIVMNLLEMRFTLPQHSIGF
jgi:hypothetical protein